MTGVDLNPVAWFVVKNELACSDPEQVKALFDHIEAEVKPRIQPFYSTTCPRGHEGSWIDIETEQTVDIDPLDLPVDERYRYRWEGPEVIYTFWAKHGSCQAKGCGIALPSFVPPWWRRRSFPPFSSNAPVPLAASSLMRNWEKPALRPVVNGSSLHPKNLLPK